MASQTRISEAANIDAYRLSNIELSGSFNPLASVPSDTPKDVPDVALAAAQPPPAPLQGLTRGFSTG